MKNSVLAVYVDEFFRDDVILCSSESKSRRKLLRMMKLLRSGQLDTLIYDTETTGLNMFSGKTKYFNKYTKEVETVDGVKIFLHQFGFVDPKNQKLYCIWIDCEDSFHMKLVRKVLKMSNITLVGHNLKYDFQVCHEDGIDVKCKLWDTMAATRLTHNRLPSHTLKYLGRLFSGKMGAEDADKWEKEVKSWLTKAKTKYTREENKRYKEEKGRPPGRLELADIKDYYNYSFVPNEIMIKYALKDIWFTFLVWFLIKAFA